MAPDATRVFLQKVIETHSTGHAREHSYRPALKDGTDAGLVVNVVVADRKEDGDGFILVVIHEYDPNRSRDGETIAIFHAAVQFVHLETTVVGRILEQFGFLECHLP